MSAASDIEFLKQCLKPVVRAAGRYAVGAGHVGLVPEREYRLDIDAEKMVLEYDGTVYRIILRDFLNCWIRQVQKDLHDGEHKRSNAP